jgi:hypothetical protein
LCQPRLDQGSLATFGERYTHGPLHQFPRHHDTHYRDDRSNLSARGGSNHDGGTTEETARVDEAISLTGWAVPSSARPHRSESVRPAPLCSRARISPLARREFFALEPPAKWTRRLYHSARMSPASPEGSGNSPGAQGSPMGRATFRSLSRAPRWPRALQSRHRESAGPRCEAAGGRQAINSTAPGSGRRCV